MKGVKFGNYHSWDSFQLILSQKIIGTPTPKVNQIEIEGGDGVLDLTDFFGGVKYGNRELSFEFSTVVPPSEFMELFTRVQNALHGQKMQIILDDEPNVFYQGRIEVDKWKAQKNIGSIVIDVDAEPFKQEIGVSSLQQRVTSNATLNLPNTRMPVVPTITTTSEFLISYGGYNDVYSAGTFTIPELELTEGNNQIYVEGSGTITFVYRRGWL